MQFGDDSGRVTIAVEGGVAQVRLARPDKLNAIDKAMFGHVAQAIDWLGAQDDLRCVVLAGKGRSFCVGLDLSVLATGLGDLAERTHGIANLVQQVCWGWRTLPVPVIAAVHGHCFGAGMQIALGADIRIAAPDAELSIMEMRHGLVPDMGLFALARGIVREDALRELVYTARKVPGEEAQALGLVTSLADDPLDAATALAAEIAGKSPDAVRAAKRLFERMADDPPAEILIAEAAEQQGLIDGIVAKMRGGRAEA